MNPDIKAMLNTMRSEMDAQKNKPQSRATILEDMLRWGSGPFDETFDYAVEHGYLQRTDGRYGDLWAMTDNFPSVKDLTS